MTPYDQRGSVVLSHARFYKMQSEMTTKPASIKSKLIKEIEKNREIAVYLTFPIFLFRKRTLEFERTKIGMSDPAEFS